MELFTKDKILLRTWNEQFLGETSNGMEVPFSGAGSGSSSSGIQSGGRIIGAILEGCSITSANSGARVEFFKSPDRGLEAYNSAGTSIFQIITSGTDTGDIILGNVANENYLKWDNSAGKLIVRGDLEVDLATIGGFDIGEDYIRDTTNSFGLASTITAGDDIRFWAGESFANRASAPFFITESGKVSASDITITGGSVSASILLGLISLGNLDIANCGWTFDGVFSSTEDDTVAWTAGTFTSANETEYELLAGDTGEMAGRVYIYFYPGNGEGQDDENLQITTDPLEAVGAGKVMIATAAPSDTEATFQIFNQNSDQKISRINIEPKTISAAEIAASTITATELATKTITANVIADNTITSSQIAANTITAGQIAANTITANEIAALTITAAEIAANTITAAKIAANTITAGEIKANTITSAEIAANTITAGQIAAGTITGNEIAASTITAGKISVTSLAAISTNLGTVTIDSTGYIRGGATGYMTGTGFFLGYDTDAYKLSIGSSASEYLSWDGEKLTIQGEIISSHYFETKSPATADKDIFGVACKTRVGSPQYIYVCSGQDYNRYLKVVYRLALQSNGEYMYDGKTVTITCTLIRGIVHIGDYVYIRHVTTGVSTNVDRYDEDLTNKTEMSSDGWPTDAGAMFTGQGNALFTDGTYIYIFRNSGSWFIDKYSIDSDEFVYISSASTTLEQYGFDAYYSTGQNVLERDNYLYVSYANEIKKYTYSGSLEATVSLSNIGLKSSLSWNVGLCVIGNRFVNIVQRFQYFNGWSRSTDAISQIAFFPVKI